MPGQQVREGEPMLEVSSPDYSLLLATYLKAQDALNLADKSYVRAQDLYEHKAIAEKDLQQAESDRNQAQADLNASEQAMKILGVKNPADLAKAPASAQVPLLAPIGGEVVERLVSPGQVLQAGTTQAFTISDMSTVWVLANVYQADLAFVHNGDDVVVQTDAYPDRFHGKISFVSPELDPNTRTLQARIVVDNPGEKLKRDMDVTATVTAGTIANAIAVPDASVLRDDENQPFVYVATSSNQFGRRSVDIANSQDGQTQILKGLAPGEKVVGNGSLFLQFANSISALRRLASYDSSPRPIRPASAVPHIMMLTVFLAIGGAVSFQRMPVDALSGYLSLPIVEIITQWPGHAAEEIERLITQPTEVEMNGVPKLGVMRSISLYGLYGRDPHVQRRHRQLHFARQIVFERLSEAGSLTQRA